MRSLVIVVGCLVLGACGSGTKSATPSSAGSLVQRTSSILATLLSDLHPSTDKGPLCNYGYSTRSRCPAVDTSTPGVVKIRLFDANESGLVKAGTDTGLWTSADAVRMGTTRAIDATQRSNDGRTTWTFHPDAGLQIVAEIH